MSNASLPLHQKYAAQGYPVSGHQSQRRGPLPEDSFDHMVTRANERKYPFPYLKDESQEVYKAYGATKTPHIFLLVKEGKDFKVAYIGAIDDNAMDAASVGSRYLEDAIAALMKGETPKTTSTKAIGCTIKAKPDTETDVVHHASRGYPAFFCTFAPHFQNHLHELRSQRNAGDLHGVVRHHRHPGVHTHRILDIKGKNGTIFPLRTTLVTPTPSCCFFCSSASRCWVCLAWTSPPFAIAGSVILFLMGLEMVLGVEIFRHEGGGGGAIVPIAFPTHCRGRVHHHPVVAACRIPFGQYLPCPFLNMIIVSCPPTDLADLSTCSDLAGLHILRRFFGIILLAIAIRLFLSNTGIELTKGM
ncbi:MAG: hypothetical protein R2751_16810 [Bacteroidales bacterium]